jgi:aminomethyltransferase
MGEALLRTALYDEHVALDGKMIPFAGYEMPVHYEEGITAEHRRVRESAGIFDASHMGEFEIRGPQALDLVQYLTVSNVNNLVPGQAQYSALCKEDGGIIDDLLVYRFAEHVMLVVNASNRRKDLAWVRDKAAVFEVEVIDRSDDTALLALQGPRAGEILQPLTRTDLEAIPYYRFTSGAVGGVDAVISRTGYTGEDGFELYVPAADAVGVWRSVLEVGSPLGLGPAGLGARDSLRLEMGYALYGNDLDEEHTPLESSLGWIVKLDAGEFVGRGALVAQKSQGVPNRLVGLRLAERGFPRPGYDVTANGRKVGAVTSGTVSPCLGLGIAMARVESAYGSPEAPLQIQIRGKAIPATVERPPFYKGGSVRR